jgi:TetR/AcrR family transcriptional repressor of lmrAB and yxaGH operons
MAKGEANSKAKMIVATLDLLRASGLSGAGINNIVAVSGTPKGSIYHFFPAGKHELVAAALRRAEMVVGESFRAIFSGDGPLPRKVRTLFEMTAERIEATAFTRGCPAAAVTLDIDDASEDLLPICDAVFATWRQIIASGLNDVPPAERDKVAQLILAALEGSLILARAQAAPGPLVDTGALLAMTLDRAFLKSREGQKIPKRVRPLRSPRHAR